MEKTAEEMISDHDKLDSGVYLVMAFEHGHPVMNAIFSKMAGAKEWMDTRPEGYQCLCAPFVIDQPDYGNTPKDKMQ